MISNQYIKRSICTSAVDLVSPGPRRRRPGPETEHAISERNTHFILSTYEPLYELLTAAQVIFQSLSKVSQFQLKL